MKIGSRLHDPPPGFRGWDPQRCVEISQRHLPHWEQRGATYFVTFRLADSLPSGVETEKYEERKRNGEGNSSAGQSSARLRAIEKALDRGLGECFLRNSKARSKLEESIRFRDGKEVRVDAYVIMPNHAHVLLQPLTISLGDWLRTRKGFSARVVNRAVGRTGRLWQQESYDTIVRDTDHLIKCLRYIGNNPVKAGLRDLEYSLWIRKDWEKLGWGFEDLNGG